MRRDFCEVLAYWFLITVKCSVEAISRMSVFSYSLESRKWHLSAFLAIRSKHLYSCSEFYPQNEETSSIGPVVNVKVIMSHLYQHLLLKKIMATRGIQICSLTELEQIIGSSAISRVMLLGPTGILQNSGLYQSLQR